MGELELETFAYKTSFRTGHCRCGSGGKLIVQVKS
jgi:hypothetical protein